MIIGSYKGWAVEIPNKHWNRLRALISDNPNLSQNKKSELEVIGMNLLARFFHAEQHYSKYCESRECFEQLVMPRGKLDNYTKEVLLFLISQLDNL